MKNLQSRTVFPFLELLGPHLDHRHEAVAALPLL